MGKSRRTWIVGIAVLTALWSIVQNVEAGTVKFATGIDASFMQIVVAVEKGFMKKHGLDAEYKPFAYGMLAIEAMVAGEADVAMGGEVAALRPKAKGGKYTTVARPMYTKDLIGVAAIKGINGPADFAGRTIGYSKGSGSDYFMNLYFKKYGVDLKSVKLLDAAPPELIPAMARGDIQVLFAWEPWFVRMKSVVKDAHVIAKSGENGVFTHQYLLNFSDAFLTQRREDARRTLLALIDATAWLNDPKNSDEAASLLVKAFRVPPDDAPRMLKEIVYVMDLKKEFVDDVRRAAEWNKDQGFITVESPAKLVDELINPELLKSVAPGRVALP